MHAIDALARIGTVADDVAQAVDLLDAAGLRIGQHGLERFEVAVDVADNGPFHGRSQCDKCESAISVHDEQGHVIVPYANGRPVGYRDPGSRRSCGSFLRKDMPAGGRSPDRRA